MHMLPRGSQRQKRWRSHPPLPRKKKKRLGPGAARGAKEARQSPPLFRIGSKKHVQSFSNTCICYEGWECNLERKFVGIIKLLNCFIFSLEFGLCLQWKKRKEELFWRGFYGCNSPKSVIQLMIEGISSILSKQKKGTTKI